MHKRKLLVGIEKHTQVETNEKDNSIELLTNNPDRIDAIAFRFSPPSNQKQFSNKLQIPIIIYLSI